MKNFYSTKLVSRSTTFLLPLGILFILLGIASIILSAIDISNSRSTLLYSATVSAQVPSVNSEQSIWPTLGKGIWCGLFFLALGIFILITYREKTLVAIRILSVVAFLSIFVGLFLFLSSILVFQRYVIDGRVQASQRTPIEQKEVVLNALLFVCGVLSLILSLILVIGTLIAGNFCQRKSDDFEHYSQHPPPPPAYSARPYYG